MLQAHCGGRDDTFQLALGVSFYLGTSELIYCSMRLEDVLQGALERFFCPANKGVIWFAEICEQKLQNQIATICLNLYLLTFPKLGILQHSEISSTKDKWKGLCSLKSELFKPRKSM